MNQFFYMGILLPVLLFSQSDRPATKTYETHPLNGEVIYLDGQFTESAWRTVEWGGGDFRVFHPNEGEAPTFQTRFKILYDAENLYIAIRAEDGEPEKIVRRKSRRDGFDGDWVEVNIDSYFDKQTAFSFNISAAGVKGDEFVSNNGGNWDASWDPVWFASTRIDDGGWNAEIRIPLSQLRFASRAQQVWGIQFTRNIFRKNERSTWIFVPQNSTGWVHFFGELHGINGIQAPRQIELLPYSVAKRNYAIEEPGNPFATGLHNDLAFGLDGKIGLTSDITMDFTINPDFGQVEADPSEVNLTAFETFFQEKRPFFIEGRNILDFPITDAAWGGSYSRDNLFYSRRIGRRPQHTPSVGEHEHLDVPVSTSILGAMKVTGKTRSGWSLGVMESLTAAENARIDSLGVRRQAPAEPLTNYFLGRVRKDFNDANTIVGALVTAVNREIDHPQLNGLHSAAYTGGVDFEHNFRRKVYFVSGNVIFSHVRGDTAAILATQTAPARYFQRPDAGNIRVDSSRTALSGHGGTLKFGRRGSFKFQSGITWRSPGIELNDMGFLRQANEINQWTWVGYRISKPFGIFNAIQFNGNNLNTWDYAGNPLRSLVNHNSNYQFRNFWNTGLSITHVFAGRSNSALRGGPALRIPGSTSFNMWLDSDQRQKLRGGTGFWRQWLQNGSGSSKEYWLWMEYQPTNSLRVSINPFYNRRRDDLQYVDTVEDRFVFARIDQETVGITLRLSYSINPELTIEYYGAPFVSAGSYRDFKKITTPQAREYADRFITFGADQVHLDAGSEEYRIDENRDGQTDFRVGRPDFNFRDFNSNLVIRWEYSPGSTLFLVWSQARSHSAANGIFSLRNDFRRLFREEPANIFLIKFNRWFSL